MQEIWQHLVPLITLDKPVKVAQKWNAYKLSIRNTFRSVARLDNLLPTHNIGPMSVVCEYRNAKLFMNESNVEVTLE